MESTLSNVVVAEENGVAVVIVTAVFGIVDSMNWCE